MLRSKLANSAARHIVCKSLLAVYEHGPFVLPDVFIELCERLICPACQRAYQETEYSDDGIHWHKFEDKDESV